MIVCTRYNVRYDMRRCLRSILSDRFSHKEHGRAPSFGCPPVGKMQSVDAGGVASEFGQECLGVLVVGWHSDVNKEGLVSIGVEWEVVIVAL